MNEKRLKEIFVSDLGIQTASLKLVQLHAHASYRNYYRAQLSGGEHFVVMQIPDGQWSVSEEISNAGLMIDELPFLGLNRYLRERGVPVPEVLWSSEKDGLIILEDLGDESLEKAIANKTNEQKEQLYKQAIDLLVDMQNKTEPKKDTCIAFKRSFDDTLLAWEFDHFFEYGIEKRINIVVSKEDRKFFKRVTHTIIDQMQAMTQVFVHRDFQSRNLMLHNKKLWLIDYQDALLGPIPYDLVALLCDSYVVLDKNLRENLMKHYLERRSSLYQRTIGHADFSQMFDMVTIQRKLKDVGRFIYIDQIKGNSDFLKYIPASLNYVKGALERQEELSKFYEQLTNYVPEWQ
jgi:N-acetylmuramate 1-kinase